MSVRPAKTQISLAQRVAKDPTFLHSEDVAHIKDTLIVWGCGRRVLRSRKLWHKFWSYIWAATWQNQQNECAPSETQINLGIRPVWSVFSVRSTGSKGPNVSSCGLGWAHSHIVGFVMSRLIYTVSLLSSNCSRQRCQYSTTTKVQWRWYFAQTTVFTGHSASVLLYISCQSCLRSQL